MDVVEESFRPSFQLDAHVAMEGGTGKALQLLVSFQNILQHLIVSTSFEVKLAHIPNLVNRVNIFQHPPFPKRSTSEHSAYTEILQ